jgi:tRNA dimethylallyltransferase
VEETFVKVGNRPFVLVITGPTASGKSQTAFQCALELDAEIISADSRQIYRHVTIGTAKPDRVMLERVPHHFIDMLELDETYTAGRFYQEARDRIHDIHARGKAIVVAGGSGLYVRALAGGIFTGSYSDPEVRKALQTELAERGSDALHRELEERDPALAAVTPASNPHRLVRALEACRISGRPFSELRAGGMPSLDYCVMLTGISWDRALLYKRIDERVDRMLDEGLIRETEDILKSGTDPSLPALNTVGYKEVIGYLSGEFPYERMRSLIQQHTRNYAKRQTTWFRKEQGLSWYQAGSDADLPVIAGNACEAFRRFRRGAPKQQCSTAP